MTKCSNTSTIPECNVSPHNEPIYIKGAFKIKYIKMTNTDIKNAEILKHFKESKKLSYKNVGDCLGCSKSLVQQWAIGERRILEIWIEPINDLFIEFGYKCEKLK